MKNLFKFGFLGLALTIGMAACNNTSNNDEATEELQDAIENAADSISAELENAADSVETVADSIVDSLEDVQ